MAYLFLTQDQQDDIVAKALRGREHEYANYELNKQNYLAILASPDVVALPVLWPNNLIRYQNIVGEDLAKSLTNPDDFAMVTKLQFRDRVQLLLATTGIEQDKTLQVYNTLLDQLPEGDRRIAAITRVAATK